MTESNRKINWEYACFDALSNAKLFAILQARQRIFILEQQCLYPDIDDIDPLAGHLVGWLDGDQSALQVAAYLRIMAPGICYPEVSIGRVLVSEKARGMGLGAKLMLRGLDIVTENYPQSALRISAQHYLESFYNDLGFVTTSEVYDEDGIPHIDMRLEAGAHQPMALKGGL